jgi:hypothetical protein
MVFIFWCAVFFRFLPLSATINDTKLTHRMTHQKDVPITAHNQLTCPNITINFTFIGL